MRRTFHERTLKVKLYICIVHVGGVRFVNRTLTMGPVLPSLPPIPRLPEEPCRRHTDISR